MSVNYHYVQYMVLSLVFHTADFVTFSLAVLTLCLSGASLLSAFLYASSFSTASALFFSNFCIQFRHQQKCETAGPLPNLNVQCSELKYTSDFVILSLACAILFFCH